MPNNITVNTASVLTPQISMNAKLPRVMPLPPAPTHQVPMSATVPVVIREMALTAKVKYLNGINFQRYQESKIPYKPM